MELVVKYENLPNSQMKLDVEIPYSEIKNEYEAVEKKIVQSIQIPGFRRGKVPESIIHNRYKSVIEAKVIEEILPKVYDQAIRDHHLEPFGQPRAEKISAFKKNEPLTVEFRVDRRPSVKIKKLSDLVIVEREIKITEKDIREEMEKRFRNKAHLSDKDGKLEMKDFARVDILVLEKENKSLELKNHPIELRISNPLPYQLLDDFLGMKKDESKKVKKKYPSHHSDKRLAAKTIEFELKVIEIKKVVFPEITQELFKESNFNNVDEFYKACQSDLIRYTESEKKNKRREQVLDGLRKEAEFDISENLVQLQAAQYLKNLKTQFKGDEKGFQSFLATQNTSEEHFLRQYKEMAKTNIENELMMEEIIKEEKLEVSEDHLNKEIEKIAESRNQDIQEMRKELIKSGEYTNLKKNLTRELVFEHVIGKGKIKKKTKITLSELLSGRIYN